MRTCVLLLGKNEENDRAIKLVSQSFELKAVSEIGRKEKKIMPVARREILKGVDYVFNFLSPAVLPVEIIKTKCINFHPAPPKYPGVGGASYAIFKEDKNYGVTCHLMRRKVDQGPILKVRRFKIETGNCERLFEDSLMHCLFLLEDVLKNPDLKPCGLNWKRKPYTRKDFEKFMDVKYDDLYKVEKKIQSLTHSKYKWPYVKNLNSAHREILIEKLWT